MRPEKTAIAIGLLIVSVSVHAADLTERVLKKGHMVCYDKSDLVDAWSSIQDENFVVPARLIESGKCLMLERDRKFHVADFDSSDPIQAVVFPSGKWGRVATVSIKR